MADPEVIFADSMRDTVLSMIYSVASGELKKQAITITATSADDGQVELSVEFEPPVSNRE